MKLMKRIKDILFDEEEVEIPVIEENSKTKKAAERKPIVEEEKTDSITEIKMPEDDFSDKESLKSELTFPFPIEFDEDELEKTKPIETFRQSSAPQANPVRDSFNSYSRYDIKKDEKPVRPEREIKDYSSYLKTKEEKKQFKPTPIISPVYGVLDQNYKKEDLIVKDEIKRNPTNKSKLDLDEIRKKAYGETQEIEETKELEVIDIDEVEVDPNKTIGELIEEESIILPEINNTKDEEIPNVELSDLIAEKENIEKKLDATNDEDDDETDLFSLIDSMYEENNE